MDELIIEHQCNECGFAGPVQSSTRRVRCPECGVENDFWIDDELPPFNHMEMSSG